MIETPQFTHDCLHCSFKGRSTYLRNSVDVYICNEYGSFTEQRTIVLRFSDKPEDYYSGMLFCTVSLSSIDRFALSHGIDLNDTEKKALIHALLREHTSRWTPEEYENVFFPEEGKENLLGTTKWFE